MQHAVLVWHGWLDREIGIDIEVEKDRYIDIVKDRYIDIAKDRYR